MGVYTQVCKRDFIDPDNTVSLCSVIPNIPVPYPLVKYSKYLVGKLITVGPGKVNMIYPVSTECSPEFEFPNVNFDFVPYVLFRIPEEYLGRFVEWRTEYGYISKDSILLLDSKNYEEYLHFYAVFK